MSGYPAFDSFFFVVVMCQYISSGRSEQSVNERVEKHGSCR